MIGYLHNPLPRDEDGPTCNGTVTLYRIVNGMRLERVTECTEELWYLGNGTVTYNNGATYRVDEYGCTACDTVYHDAHDGEGLEPVEREHVLHGTFDEHGHLEV